MKKLNYRVITKDNFYEITNLWKTLTKEQQKCVAPNGHSIGEGSVHPCAYYRGVYLDDTPVGFFMLYIPTEEMMKKPDEDFYLWRFMIAYEHQHKHYGKEVLDHIVEMGKEKGFKKLVTSARMGEVSPYDFYIKYGFIDTGVMDHGEEVLEFTF